MGSARGKPSQTPARANNDRQTGEAVGAGVVAVGHQRRAVDLASHPDAEHRHSLVSDEPDQAGERHPAQMTDWLWVNEAGDRLVAGDQCAEQDDQHDDDPGEVLHPPVAVSEGCGRLAPRQQESDPQRDGGRRIADIVDGVGKQRDAARDGNDRHLKGRRDRQQDERPFDGEDAPAGRRNRRIDNAVGMAVAMPMPMIMVMAIMMMPMLVRRDKAEPFLQCLKQAALTDTW